MIPPTSRRNFLGSAALIGGWLAVPGMHCPARAEAEGEGVSPSSVTIEPVAAQSDRQATIAVVTQSVSRDVRPRAGAWPCISEVLRRAGLFFTQLPPSALTSLRDRGHSIVLLAGHLPLAAQQRKAVPASLSRTAVR